MKTEIIHTFLKSFFQLFEADVERIDIDGKLVYGTVGWKNEDDKQDFKWLIEFSEEELYIIKLLCDYLSEKKLIKGDKVKIPEDELKLKLVSSGWSHENVEKSIDCLALLEIKMLDNAMETDSFFIHW